MPRQLDTRALVVDRDPTWSLFQGGIPNLPKLDAEMLWQGWLDAIKLYTGIDLTSPAALVASIIDLLNTGVENVIATITQAFGMLATGGVTPTLDELTAWITENVFGAINPGRLPMIPLSHIGELSANLLTNGGFGDGVAINDPSGKWTVDTTTFYGASGGSARVTADGALHELLSIDLIQCTPGQKLDLAARIKRAGVTAAAGSILLGVQAYPNADGTGTPIDTTVVAVPSPSGTADWTQYTGNYVVPSSGVKSVRVRIAVLAGATAGTVNFDDLSAVKSGLLAIDFVDGLGDELGAFQSALGAAVDDIADKLGLGTWQDFLNQIKGGPGGVIADLIDRIIHLGVDGSFDASQLGNINNIPPVPATNVFGVGGTSSVVDAFEQTWSQLWGGFARSIGVDKSIADAANAATNVSEQAQTATDLGVWNNAILGLRNNKSLMEGMDETSESNFLLSDMLNGAGDPPIIAATAASVPMSFWRARETATKGFISWFGKGVTNVTALYIDLYKLSADKTTWTLFHTSANQIGQFPAGGAWALGLYYLPQAARFQVNAGDVIGVAWRVTGTGTHSVAGKLGSWLPADPSTYPSKPGASRTGSGNIAASSLTYTGDTAWFGIGIAAGDVPPPYQAPRTTEISTTGAYTYTIPSWANYIDVILLGGGAGGHGGNGGNGQGGDGGLGGNWVTETLVRGVDFPTNTTQLTGYVGAGGAGGPKEQAGDPGGTTSRLPISGGKTGVAAGGGLSGGGYASTQAQNWGMTPGNQTYGGTTYIGGATVLDASAQNGAPGNAPGGGGAGGAGGIYTVAWAGGAGARGGAWFVARQS
ncbi:minor tail protein [Mycobacterium phage Aminay]|uniref:Minor tail protein n=1 Tax=Mycobacterium phage Aminay TaxID=2250291 RepID=A0A345KV11_9CAUD|nr:minor tail protein [Mycobacterium phage Aminay]AXH46863.1 minor tail protein [Mycobacterium phage Aminay]